LHEASVLTQVARNAGMISVARLPNGRKRQTHPLRIQRRCHSPRHCRHFSM